MKLLNLTAILMFFLFLVTSCTKDEKPKITSLEVEVTSNKILSDGVDNAVISVLDQNGINVTKLVTLYFNDKVSASSTFKSTLPGTFEIYALYDTLKSNVASIEVIEDAGLLFRKNVLLEQYTGTWCGWCPRAIGQIESLQSSDNQIVHVALHLSDAMTYFQNSALFQSFGFTGVPTVHADRKTQWNGDSYVISSMHSPSRAGIALEVSGDQLQVAVIVRARFGNAFKDGLKLSVYMVHDSLVANQSNFYNDDPSSEYYQKGKEMTGFIHRNVMTKSGLDMFGESIPANSVDVGSTYSKTVYISGFRCDDIRQVKVVAFLTYSGGPKNGQVVNSLIARVGQNKGFETVDK
jgi:thiol-disulfide isomerase/thioredoxin